MLVDRARAAAKRESVEQAGSPPVAVELTKPLGYLLNSFAKRSRLIGRL